MKNHMKKVVLIAFALCFTLVSKAQQDPQFTHFMFDKLSFNPASVGFKDAFCLTAISRRQWTGFDSGEPNTTLINFTAPRISLIKGGLGFSYYNDQIGWETNNVFRLSYALHLSELGVQDIGGGNFAIGLSAGYFQKNINATWETPDGIPPGDLAGQDNSIPTSTQNEGGFSFNAGVYYRNPIFYAGVSTTNITQSELETLKITGARHYFGMAGADLTLPGGFTSNFVLRPNVLIKSDGVKTQYDLNLNVLAFNTFWAGATYRHNDAIAPMAGLQWKGLRIGYSYGLGTSFLSNYFTNGNHEIMLNYCFRIVPVPKEEKEVHPYFL